MTSAFPGPVSGDGQPSCSFPAAPSVLVQRYELGPLLGQGGSAQVHWAWDRLMNRAVAVKLFAPGVAGPDRYRQEHELTALTRLVHPGLVELYDAGADHGRAYLVMRLVQGPSLADRFQDVPLRVATVAEWGAQLADTLAYVHSHGVIHRDIKPANVLLDEQDHALLADFGIALLADITRVTLTGAVIGTAAYMAPEQVRGELVGPPADVYALGLVLLEALTGRREYPGTGVESACARLHRAPAVPENLPAGLTQTLRRMTTIEPVERLSAPAAVSMLQAAATDFQGGPTAVHTAVLTEALDDPMQPVGPPGRRRAVLAGAASGVALAAGLLSLTALDPTTGGTTGTPSLPPSAADPYPAAPTGTPRSAASPDAPVVPRQETRPSRSAAPPAVPVVPRQVEGRSRSEAEALVMRQQLEDRLRSEAQVMRQQLEDGFRSEADSEVPAAPRQLDGPQPTAEAPADGGQTTDSGRRSRSVRAGQPPTAAPSGSDGSDPPDGGTPSGIQR